MNLLLDTCTFLWLVQVAPMGLENIRAKMIQLGLTEELISAAVRCAREHS